MLGEQPTAMVAYAAAEVAFLTASGDPALAGRDVALIVAAAARDHPDWFWRPARERIAREERWWKARGVWPPPKGRSVAGRRAKLSCAAKGPLNRGLATKIEQMTAG